MNEAIIGFVNGFLIPARGLREIFKSKKVALFSIIPFLLGLLILFLGFFLASEYINPFMNQWIKGLDFFSGPGLVSKVLAGILTFFYWILLSVANLFLSYLTIVIIAGPFYALLAEQIFIQYWPEKPLKLSLGASLKMLMFGLIKALIFIIIGLTCFILSVIPFLNLTVTFILFLMISYDGFDYALEIDGKNLKQRWAFFKSSFWELSGMALAVVLTSLVPGGFFILLPAFICGATKLYIQKLRPAV